MVRLRDDVTGCGCVRCQGVDFGRLHPTLSGAFVWGCRYTLTRPSILLVFAAVGVVQLLTAAGPEPAGLGGAILGPVLAFAGRGYVGIRATGSLGRPAVSAVAALGRVARRLPAFVGAGALTVCGLGTLVLLVRVAVSPVAHGLLGRVGVTPLTVDLVLLGLLTCGIMYLLVRLCFVPEACFLGGYGPIGSLRVSWTLTNLRPGKAAALVVAFGVALAVGLVFDLSVAGSDRPVLLAVRYGDVRVVLRSFGLSMASGVRLAFDLLATAVFSGVFVHQYVSGVVGW